MRKNLFATAGITVVLCASVLVSCKKKEEEKKPNTPPAYVCSSCNAAPEAKAANDASSKGIYKGVVIGSTGTIKFDISNDASSITAVLTIDGVSATLTSAVTWTTGTAYVGDFTGTFNGSPVTVQFKVDATGANPVVLSSSIPGHSGATFILDKELSTSLLECFEGTYSTTKPETGTFNVLISRKLNKMGGISRKDGSGSANGFKGTMSGDDLIMEGKKVGTLSADEINGSFVDNNGSTVTIKGKRTR